MEDIKKEVGDAVYLPVDALLGERVVGKPLSDAVTKKFPAKTTQGFMRKIPGFLARQVAPRIAGAAAGPALSPVGTVMGFIAPELAYQGIDYLFNSPPTPDTFKSSAEREDYYRTDSQSTAPMPFIPPVVEQRELTYALEPSK